LVLTIILIVAFTGLMASLGAVLVRCLFARAGAEFRRRAETLAQIESLPLEEAASRAESLLAAPQFFRCIESPTTGDGALDALPPHIKTLLRRYESVELLRGPRAVINRSSIGPSASRSGFLRIGTLSPATDVQGELGVRPGEETVYELYANEAPDPTLGTYPSINHWIVAMAEAEEA
jgi:hypothetical protein